MPALALAGCSGDDGGTPAAAAGASSGGASGSVGSSGAAGATTVGGGGASGSAATAGGSGGALGAAGSSAGSSLDGVTTLPLPAPGTPGIDYLSDLEAAPGAQSGWGPFEKDMTNGWTDAGDGASPIDLFAGATYTKGIGCHAYSKISYALGGAYKLFIADIGYTFNETPGGTVVFQVVVDGVTSFDSGMFTKDSMRAQTVKVDVTGKNTIDLVVTDGGDGMFGDHVAWAGARLMK